jgi:hypothetical protein
MTRLTRPVKRRATLKRGEVTIRLMPPDRLEFRFYRTRRWYPLDLNILLARAVAAAVLAPHRRRTR